MLRRPGSMETLMARTALIAGATRAIETEEQRLVYLCRYRGERLLP
jgi:hypothetical protein